MTALQKTDTDHTQAQVTDARLRQEARRVLRRLCETGAMLAVATDMDKAVVVRETVAGTNRVAVVDRDVAEAMALKNWIVCNTPGRISRYVITGAGRVALDHLLAESEQDSVAFPETEGRFLGEEDAPDIAEKRPRKRYGIVETPLMILARRRDRDGSRFLSEGLVRAGERLREDYEMAHLGLEAGDPWEHLLSETSSDPDAAPSTRAARERVMGALRDLGPGLGDVSLRCCCFLEGLEIAEKRMGWSARSGKIVLRIALQRLKRHYDTLGDAASMMG